MSNLSELLPAGSSVKSADFVAQGTLASGVTVGLRSDGKVEAITGVTQAIGTPTDLSPNQAYEPQSAYDPDQNKTVVSYVDLSNSNRMAVVVTVSGTSVSYGTPVNYDTNTQNTSENAIVYDTTANKIVLFWKGQSNYGYYAVGTVSGTSISFGTPATFNTAGATLEIAACFDSTAGKTIVCFSDNSSGSYISYALVCTVSGTSLTFGSKATILASARWNNPVPMHSTTDNKTLVYYRDQANSYYISGIVLVVSGTSVSAPSAKVVLDSKNGYTDNANYDPSSNKFLAAIRGRNGSGSLLNGEVLLISLSGNTPSLDSTTVFEEGGNPVRFAQAYNATIGGSVVSFQANTAGYAAYVTLTVSGTTVTISSTVSYDTDDIKNNPYGIVYDSGSGATVVSYPNDANSLLTTTVIKPAATNVSSYIGITDQAISSAATGKVVCKGGAITNTGLIPAAPVAGTAVVFKASRLNYTASTFDSTNNKIVISYKDYNNSFYGTAIVGTVSGSSISFGSPVVFQSSTVNNNVPVFDSNANKIVIVYREASSGKAIVGTVSGTSISFGTAVNFDSGVPYYPAATFDSNLNKIVIIYSDSNNNNYGTGIVGTVSGTSISFGTATVFLSAYAEHIATTFDSNSNKVVADYTYGTGGEADWGRSIVGTVSGTSISFGSQVTRNSGTAYYNSNTFDIANNKVVSAFKDGANSSAPTAIVGTVSGTSISFGTKVAISPYSSNYTSATFDSNQNKVIISYEDNTVSGSAQIGTVAAGTVSGTSISFGTPVVFNSTASSVDITSAFDSNLNKTVISYQDGTGGSQVGESVVIDLSSALTPNTAYFVQDDGTISTTSSTTKAGTALSTTSLLLTG